AAGRLALIDDYFPPRLELHGGRGSVLQDAGPALAPAAPPGERVRPLRSGAPPARAPPPPRRAGGETTPRPPPPPAPPLPPAAVVQGAGAGDRGVARADRRGALREAGQPGSEHREDDRAPLHPRAVQRERPRAATLAGRAQRQLGAARQGVAAAVGLRGR